MISAREFARQSSVWRQVTPMLDRVVRWSNTRQESLGTAVRSISDPQRNSLIAESGFLFAGAGISFGNPEGLTLEERARAFVQELPRGEYADDDLTEGERAEAYLLAQNLRYYVARLGSIRWSPSIPGCGVVAAAIGDISAVDEIVEVKSVTRAFRSQDLRQLITYATMLYAGGTRIRTVTLLNPRRARFVSLPTNVLADGAGSGTDVDLFEDLVKWMTGLQVSA